MNIFSWAGRIQYGTQIRYGPHPKYFGEHIFKSVKINSSRRRMSKVKINKHLKMIVITTNIKYIIFHIREVLMLYNLYDFTVAQLCYLYQYIFWSFKCKKIFIIEDSNIYIFLINCTTAVLYMGLISSWSGVYIFKKIYLL